MILSGEVEVLNAGPIEEEDGNDDYGDDDYTPSAAPAMSTLIHDDAQMDLHVPLPKPGDVNPFAHSVSQQPRGSLQLQTILPRPAHQGPHTPMIVQSPTAVSFENPAMASLYEPHHHLPQAPYTPGGQYVPQAPHMGGPVHEDKWGAPMYSTQVPGGPAMFTPPASSHGAGNVSPMNVGAPGQQQQQQAYLMNLQRQHMMQQQQQQQHDGSPSSGPRRERSGSVNSNGSGYASPVSNPGSSYEMPSVMNGGAGA
ncbi:hypothetical protein FKP32DRAFT_1675065, partial [Trametes sanguinea]